MTPVEKTLWYALKAKRFENTKFRRQHTISDYTVDFYHHPKKLFIEVDGLFTPISTGKYMTWNTTYSYLTPVIKSYDLTMKMYSSAFNNPKTHQLNPSSLFYVRPLSPWKRGRNDREGNYELSNLIYKESQ